jgi:hypothetical protein
MPLIVNDLADAINTAIAAKDKDGNDISTTDEMKTYAQAVVDTLQSGLVNNAPGTINGVGIPITPATPPPANTFIGTGAGGLMTLVPATWIGDMMAGFPTANPAMISGEATSSTGYLMASGTVAITSVTGLDTAVALPPPPAPGILAVGAGTGGTISGLAGAAWSVAVVSGFPGADPALAKKIYDAISNYIQANAIVAYSAGTIVGTFAPGGGPLIAGSGIGGTIS